LDINMVLSQLGIDKMVDMDKLNDQLKNMNEDEIQDVTKNITEILGANNDDDVKEVCSTLVRNIVDNLKENGISNMIETLSSISKNVGDKIDPNKMKKTAASMNTFMQNSESHLRNLKDENGNNIGDKIFKTMGKPLELAKYMSEMNAGGIEKMKVGGKKGDNKNNSKQSNK
jgi:hypothetical protein